MHNTKIIHQTIDKRIVDVTRERSKEVKEAKEMAIYPANYRSPGI